MLNPDFKEKWLTALESGQYQQTTGVLHDGQSYCCLGVACAVLGATFVDRLVGEPDDEFAHNYRPMLNDTDLGDDQALGYEGLTATGLTQAEQEVLYNMNDGGSSFVEIAAYIRENL